MILDQRRTTILETIEKRGFVSLQELLELIDASESTIRRDLEYLDSIGQIRRTRGGASYTGDAITSFDARQHKSSAEKRRIAQFTAGLIEPGEAVLLDGGTTTLEVAKFLKGKRLQVVTNSLPIASLLVNLPEIELVMIGGYLYPQTGVALGSHAMSVLESVHVRRLIMSAGGITEKGLFNSNSLLVETEQKMMTAAEEVILVSDSSKLGHSALAHLCPLESIDRLVIDDGISEEWKERIEKVGIQLHIV